MVSEAVAASLLTEVLISKTEFKAALLPFSEHDFINGVSVWSHFSANDNNTYFRNGRTFINT